MSNSQCQVICCKIYKLKEQRGDQDFTDENNFYVVKESQLFSNSGDYQYRYRHKLNKILKYVPVEVYGEGKTHFQLQEEYFNNQEIDKSQYQNPEDFIYIKYYLTQETGCEHYVRGCQVECNICKQFFSCRFCHDEHEIEHTFPRYETQNVKCNKCDHIQSIGKTECEKCDQRFGRYCDQCKLYDNLPDEGKPIFHCNGCGMCRVGIKEYFIHCDKCNMCYFKNAFEGHMCQNLSDECPICLQPLQGSQMGVHIPPCRHGIHLTCMLKSHSNYCPVCRAPYPVEKLNREQKIQLIKKRINQLHSMITHFSGQGITEISQEHINQLDPDDILFLEHIQTSMLIQNVLTVEALRFIHQSFLAQLYRIQNNVDDNNIEEQMEEEEEEGEAQDEI